MSLTDSNFHIGDKVVYPNHGVGVIEQISSRSVGATVERFYLLNIKASSLRVMVPCQNAGSVGLRRVVKNGEIQKVLDLLSISGNGTNGDWKDRFKENSERMRTGSLLEVAGVLKNLIALHQAKPLSFREKKMLERARYLLVSELAMARNCEESKAFQELREPAPDAEHCYLQKEREAALRDAISSLRPSLRSVVEVAQLGERSVRETAEIIGLSVCAIKARLFHARAALRKSRKLRRLRNDQPVLGSGLGRNPNLKETEHAQAT